jgi:hypothetical protein
VNRAFGYWFDYGDDWMHQINVMAIEDAKARPAAASQRSQRGSAGRRHSTLMPMNEMGVTPKARESPCRSCPGYIADNSTGYLAMEETFLIPDDLWALLLETPTPANAKSILGLLRSRQRFLQVRAERRHANQVEESRPPAKVIRLWPRQTTSPTERKRRVDGAGDAKTANRWQNPISSQYHGIIPAVPGRCSAPESIISWEEGDEVVDRLEGQGDSFAIEEDGNVICDPDAGKEESGDEEPSSPEGERRGDSGITETPSTGEGSPSPKTTPPSEGDEEVASPGNGVGGGEDLVDDPAQVQKLLQNVDKMDREHITQVAKIIWGDDYKYEDWMTDDYVREDLRGSLEDVLESHGIRVEGAIDDDDEE